MTRSELLAAIADAFDPDAHGLAAWPNPRPEGASASEEEYSRLTDAERFRIIGCRAHAWLTVLESAGLAVVDRDVRVEWTATPGPVISRTDVVRPTAAGALPLVLATTLIGEVADAGVLIGVGEPAVDLGRLPDCGCDACDSGSQNELAELDRMFLDVVTGSFRRLTLGDRAITVEDGGWSASGRFGRDEIEVVIADSTGWSELSGAPW